MDRTFDQQTFRRAMGAFATGITIMTTPDDDTSGTGIHGMTANSFTSVSLDPPLVLVSVDKRTRMHGLVDKQKVFGVTVLDASQEGVSRHFAGQPNDEVAKGLRYEWVDGIPVLADGLTTVACKLWAQYDGGDHTLYIGEVVQMTQQEGAPLLYVRGQYKQVGN
ncbi:MAG: flavin reductase family protein [Firmicutes bacterium]|nr:flavin reductase family protein [Bacillota bacterium]